MGEHYSATHFALACALAYGDGAAPAALTRARKAIAFHIRTSVDEYKGANWPYHWEFNNLAFFETYQILRPHLGHGEARLWRTHIANARWSRASATNWVAMRGLAALKRREIVRRTGDSARWTLARRRVLRAQDESGLFLEQRNKGVSLQYHAYTVALILAFAGLASDARLQQAAIRGAERILDFMDDNGGWSYLGRGQNQIFGEAAAIYVCVQMAVRVIGEAQCAWLTAASKLVGRLASAQRADGALPLILNGEPVQSRRGWSDYHHVTVYNAFAAAWLMRAIRTVRSLDGPCTPSTSAAVPSRSVYRAIGIVVEKRRTYALVAGGHRGEYGTDAAGTIHHLSVAGLGPLVSCPGDPGLGRYGDLFGHPRGSEQFCAPMALSSGSGWTTPLSRLGTAVTLDSAGTVTLRASYGGLLVQRLLRFADDEIEIEDRVHTTRDFTVVRYASVPVQLRWFSPREEANAVACASVRAPGRVVRIESICDNVGCSWVLKGNAWSAEGEIALACKEYSARPTMAERWIVHKWRVCLSPAGG